jgi:alpha-glucosidase
MRPFRQAALHHADADGVVLVLDSGWRCRIAIVAPGIGRMLMLPPEGLREPRSWAIVDGQERDPWQGAGRLTLFANAVPATLTRNANSILLSDALLRVHITLAPLKLRWEQRQGDTWQLCCADRPTFGYASSARGGGSGLTGHWQQRDEHDQYFGLGDKTGPLDKSGRRFRTRQLDALGYNAQTSDPLYKHWPFFIGRRADSGACHGIYYDTLAECTFDFGQEFDNYHGFYRATEIADGDLDFYIFSGPDIASALARFVATIGGTAMPPRWSLGYANTAMALADAPDAQARVAEFLATAVRLGFPLSSFHFGSGYSSRGKRRYVFTWNRDKFPDPQALLQAFRVAGVRTVANLKPCLLDDHPAFEPLAAAGGFVREAGGAVCLDPFWDGWGAHLDFAREGDRRWWQDNLQQQVLEFGFDAGWNDNNEYPIWNEAARTETPAGPLPMHRSRPLHALLMTQATAQRQQEIKPDERPFTITRAGPPGIQRVAQTWSGDNTTSWHTLRWNQRMALTMSLSGLFNTGHDIGGFAGPVPEPELLIRWSQACCLVPRMIMNSWKADGSVNSPWLHLDATDTIREAVRLRLHLMPYLYTLMWQAAREHRPVLRPTFFHFPDDANCWFENDEMMVGPQLLVAPVFQPGQRERTLYLPKGVHAEGWHDFWSGRHWPGGASITVPAALDRLPLFVRTGALLPTTDTWDDDRLRTEEPSRALRYYPPPAGTAPNTSHAEMFEDDGLQVGDAPARQQLLRFDARAAGSGLHLELAARGSWPLPYAQIRVELPPGELRPLSLASSSVPLVR